MNNDFQRLTQQMDDYIDRATSDELYLHPRAGDRYSVPGSVRTEPAQQIENDIEVWGTRSYATIQTRFLPKEPRRAILERVMIDGTTEWYTVTVTENTLTGRTRLILAQTDAPVTTKRRYASPNIAATKPLRSAR